MRTHCFYMGVGLLAAVTSCAKTEGRALGGSSSASSAVTAPSQDAIQSAIDQLIQPLIDDQWAESVVVGTVTQEGSQIIVYSQLSTGDSQLPDADTLFEIGSLTKVFTALLLADMVERGEVSLDDPIQEFLPDEVQVPRRADGDIRLVELATHTSGLPHIGDNFWRDGDNIFDADVAARRWAGYSQDDIYECLQRLDSPIIGEREFAYSNFGMGLLGHILERQSGKGYEELLIERICDPLEMTSTRITLTDDLRSRWAQGHNADGAPTEPWEGESSALVGAFGIRSTPHDLQNFLKANLGLMDSPLSSAIQAAHSERFVRNDLERVGLGWNRNKFNVVFHTGTTGGFRCSMFMLPEFQVGAFVVTNTQVGGSTDSRAFEFETVGGSLLNILVGVPPLPMSLPKPLTIDPEQLADYVGHFKPSPEEPESLEITQVDGTLQVSIPGLMTRQLYLQADDVFFMKEYALELAFERDESGAVSSVTARHVGGSQILHRVIDE